MKMDNQDSCHKAPLSVQIAMAMIGDDKEYEKIKASMIKDGFQHVWGVRKASEWILQIKSEKKRKHYSRYLVCMWTKRSQGFLTESDGEPVPLFKLREKMKDATDKLSRVAENLMGTVPTLDLKDPKGIVDYILVVTELVTKIEVAIAQAEENVGQTAAVPGPTISTAPAAPLQTQDSVFPSSPPPPTSQVRMRTPQMSSSRPDDIQGADVNVTYRGNGLQGNLGTIGPMTRSTLSHILQSLPPLKKQDPNVDFWIKLKDAVITFALEYREVITVIRSKAPLGYAVRLADASWPKALPDSDQAWELHLTTCEKITQEILGRGHHSFALLTTCIQGPKEPFTSFAARFEEKHRVLSACRPDTPDLESSFIIDTAAENMSEKYRQMWVVGLPVIDKWSAFLNWGQRAEAHMAQFSDRPRKAIVQNKPAFNSRKKNNSQNCHSCGKSGHWAKNCWKVTPDNRSHTSEPGQQHHNSPEMTSEMLTLLRSLARFNIADQ